MVYEVEARLRDLRTAAGSEPEGRAGVARFEPAASRKGQEMNCYLHTETPASAFCRDCGRALCTACQHPFGGTIFCQEHIPQEHIPRSLYLCPPLTPHLPARIPIGRSIRNRSRRFIPRPVLPSCSGMIPGVGAIYNGQYLKGLVHAVIFGLLISFANAAENGAGAPDAHHDDGGFLRLHAV